jgi:hypothetical protein
MIGPAAGSSADVAEFAAAALCVLVAIRTFVVWQGREFRASSTAAQVLYTLHVAARIGLWLAFAALFLGYGVVDRPKDFAWFIVVPMVMAGVQLMTALALGRGGDRGGDERAPGGD